MTSLLNRGRPYILSVLRIVVALLFLEAWLAKIFWLPFGWPADENASLRSRRDRDRRWSPTPHRCIYAAGRLYSRRRHGRCLFRRALPTLLLPCGEWRGRGSAILFRLLLLCLRRWRALEPRSLPIETGLTYRDSALRYERRQRLQSSKHSGRKNQLASALPRIEVASTSIPIVRERGRALIVQV